MRVRARATDPGCHVTASREYVVHALSVWRGITHVLIVDDMEDPWFKPRSLFDTVDPSLPSDWIGSVFPEAAVQLVLGPAFLAGSLEAYESMIDGDQDSRTAFWSRAEKLAATARRDELLAFVDDCGRLGVPPTHAQELADLIGVGEERQALESLSEELATLGPLPPEIVERLSRHGRAHGLDAWYWARLAKE